MILLVTVTRSGPSYHICFILVLLLGRNQRISESDKQQTHVDLNVANHRIIIGNSLEFST